MLLTRFGLAIVLLTTILITPSMAAEWQLIGESLPASKYYIDKTSLTYSRSVLSGKFISFFVTFWVKVLETKVKPQRNTSKLFNYTIDCLTKKVQFNGGTIYVNGSYDESISGSHDFDLIVPDSMGEILFKEVCLPLNHTDQ